MILRQTAGNGRLSSVLATALAATRRGARPLFSDAGSIRHAHYHP